MHLSPRIGGLSAMLFSTLVFAADDDKLASPDKLPPSDAASKTESHANAGIETQPMKPASRQPEFSAFGSVLSLEPLLDLRQQYLTAQAQQDSAAAKYQEADFNLNRTRNLHQHDIVSTRRLQEQQAQWRNDKANLATSGFQQQTLLAASRLQWGDTLTNWFTRNSDKQAEQLLSQRAQLLEIILPAHVSLGENVRHIAVNEHGNRSQAVTATLISPAPRVDPVTQGKRYFFSVEGGNLPFGAHIHAWIPTDAAQNAGVIIPENAVVWHLGQALVFIKTGDGDYKKRLLPEQIQIEGGYFAATGFVAGEEIVTTGAQTLLSQELKKQIPDEDDD
ncbi:MAG: hypothetical protein PHH11_17870 [Methylomonas sp.]|nr:hypothetical protein [Methylomonas sp.]